MNAPRFKDFEQFRDHENGRADVSAMGMLFKADGASSSVQDTVGHRIGRILESQRQRTTGSIDIASPEKVSALRELLSKEVLRALREHDKTLQKQMSMLDRTTLGHTTPTQIEHYLSQYGYSISNPKDREKVYEVFMEAIDHFDEYVAPHTARKSKIHKFLRSDINRQEAHRMDKAPEGIHRLFLTASGMERSRHIPQACALLRIAYVIWYMEKDPRLSLVPNALKKLSDMKDLIINNPFFADRITTISIRPKVRERIITKLLHKAKNSTEDVLDHLGMQIIVSTPVEAIRMINDLFFNKDHALFPETSLRLDKTGDLLLRKNGRTSSRAELQKLIELALRKPEEAQRLLSVETTSAEDGYDGESETNRASAKNYRDLSVVFEMPVAAEPFDTPHIMPIDFQVLDLKSAHINEVHASHDEYERVQERDVTMRIYERRNLLSQWNALSGRAA